MTGGPLPPDDPLLQPVPPAGQEPPPYRAPYPYPSQYGPPYPYQQESPADQEFQVHWPKSWMARGCIIILGGLSAWLIIRKEIDRAGELLALILGFLGLGRNAQSLVRTFATQTEETRKLAATAAAATQRIAHDVHVTKETVRDIANDPAKPGSPGTMERLEGGKPPFANL